AECVGARVDDLSVGLFGLLQLPPPVQVGGALPGGRVVVDPRRWLRSSSGLRVGPLLGLIERVEVVDQHGNLGRDPGLLRRVLLLVRLRWLLRWLITLGRLIGRLRGSRRGRWRRWGRGLRPRAGPLLRRERRLHWLGRLRLITRLVALLSRLE